MSIISCSDETSNLPKKMKTEYKLCVRRSRLSTNFFCKFDSLLWPVCILIVGEKLNDNSVNHHTLWIEGIPCVHLGRDCSHQDGNVSPVDKCNQICSLYRMAILFSKMIWVHLLCTFLPKVLQDVMKPCFHKWLISSKICCWVIFWIISAMLLTDKKCQHTMIKVQWMTYHKIWSKLTYLKRFYFIWIEKLGNPLHINMHF